MEKVVKTPSKIPTADTENHHPDKPNTPPPRPPPTGKKGTPDRLKVPKPFKYPERYTSPTDQMMSPVTRGILARSRKGSKLLPPSSTNQIKIQTLQIQDLDKRSSY